MKVSELEGALLDYWVGKADGMRGYGEQYVKDADYVAFRESGKKKCYAVVHQKKGGKVVRVTTIPYSPSKFWQQGGPIIERYGIDTTVAMESCYGDDLPNAKRAWSAERDGWAEYWGSTPLIAAMRCYVASKFGDEVSE